MQNARAPRLINPRLQTYFSIFVAAFVALILLALIGEQLALEGLVLRWGLLLVPLVLYAAVGMAAATRDPLEYFAAGRRVPAVYTGLALAFTAYGGTGLVAIAGTMFLVGFDGMCLAIGGLAGFVVMGVLLAPFYRKFGAYSVPSYLGRRFESVSLRRASAAVLSFPLALMLVAEIKTSAFAGSFLTRTDPGFVAVIVAAFALAALWWGGMRSLTWSSVATSIAALLALVVPVSIVAISWTNLPLPQMSYGPLLRSLARDEATQGLPLILAQGFTFDLPGSGLANITKRFASSFSSVGPSGFVAAVLTIMMGLSVAPWLLPRVAAARGVYNARKSIGWATLFFGVVMLTLASVGAFMRVLLFDATQNGAVPQFISELAARGYAEVDTRSAAAGADAGRGILTNVYLVRDVVLLALPMAAGMAWSFAGLAAVGVIAAAQSGMGAAANALGTVLSEDLLHGSRAEAPLDAKRLLTDRLCVTGAIAAGLAGAVLVPGDPLDMVLWAVALTGSTLFPVLVLSIWWKRINAFGATAGVLSGFGVGLISVIAGEMEWLPIDPSLAGLFGIPASLIATLAATLSTPYPGRHMLELVRDIRVPGGEILYDREMRLLRLKKRQRPSSRD